MIFTKEFVVEKFQEKINDLILKNYPFQTNDVAGEVSSGKNMFISYYQYFDLKSEETKDLMLKSRREINEKCFTQENMGVYPNTEKIDNCIKSVENKFLGKLYDNRNLYFGNAFLHFTDSLKNCPSTGKEKCMENLFEQFVWDTYKAKYYLKENFKY